MLTGHPELEQLKCRVGCISKNWQYGCCVTQTNSATGQHESRKVLHRPHGLQNEVENENLPEVGPPCFYCYLRNSPVESSIPADRAAQSFYIEDLLSGHCRASGMDKHWNAGSRAGAQPSNSKPALSGRSCRSTESCRTSRRKRSKSRRAPRPV